MRIPLAALAVLAALSPAMGHDDAGWILQGQHKNARGEFCCGPMDCKIEHDAVARVSGWTIEGEGSRNEFVPYSEAKPTPDGRLWICRYPDGRRRCTFGLTPGT